MKSDLWFYPQITWSEDEINLLSTLNIWKDSHPHYLIKLLFFSCEVVSNSLWPHGLQHTRLFCPSLSPGVCSNSRPLSLWCHPNIFSSSVASSPPAISLSQHQDLLIMWPKDWSFKFSISPSTEYSGFISFRIDWFDSLQSKTLWRVFNSTTIQRHQFFGAQHSWWSKSHIHTW